MKIKNKKYFTLLTIISIQSINLLTPLNKATAIDLEITCNNEDSNNPCQTTQGNLNPIFNVSDWAPGKTQSQTVTIVNEDLEDSCKAGLVIENIDSNPQAFGDRIFSSLRDGSVDLVGILDSLNNATSTSTIAQQATLGTLNLGTIEAGQIKTITWTTTFDPETPNEYQSAQLKFDAEFSFECNYEEDSTPSNPTNWLIRFLRWLRKLIARPFFN